MALVLMLSTTSDAISSRPPWRAAGDSAPLRPYMSLSPSLDSNIDPNPEVSFGLSLSGKKTDASEAERLGVLEREGGR